MKTIERDQHVLSFSRQYTPALTVQSGEWIRLQTHDCFSGQIASEEDRVTSIDYSRINPATGPIYVEGAESGDVLKVDIGKIAVGKTGVIATLPGIGTLIHRSEMKTKVVTIQDSSLAIFDERIQFPLRPMVGVIGVAPADGDVPCGHPGSHGGNLDSSCITTGSSVYLPVFVPGGGFALGDLHASMGDGEICGTGIEVAGEVDVRLTVIKGLKISSPVVETADSWYTIASDHDVLQAVRMASENMQALVAERWDLSQTDAFLLMGAVGDVMMSQCCKPCSVETVSRFRMPKVADMPRLLP